MNTRRIALAVVALLVLGTSFAGAAPSRSEGTGEGLKLVAEIPLSGATLMEMATIKGRDYAFVSQVDTAAEKLTVIDITQPESPKVKASIPCNGNQGNVQVSHDKKTLVIGIDVPSVGGCMSRNGMGFVTIDISNPVKPRPIGYAPIDKGSHSLAAHPT